MKNIMSLVFIEEILGWSAGKMFACQGAIKKGDG